MSKLAAEIGVELDLIHKVFDIPKLSAAFVDKVVLAFAFDDSKSPRTARFFGRMFAGLLDPGIDDL